MERSRKKSPGKKSPDRKKRFDTDNFSEGSSIIQKGEESRLIESGKKENRHTGDEKSGREDRSQSRNPF
jgi:hypothetical protein